MYISWINFNIFWELIISFDDQTQSSSKVLVMLHGLF